MNYHNVSPLVADMELLKAAGCGPRRETSSAGGPAYVRAAGAAGWRKRRRECPNSACGVGSFTEQDHRIAPERGC